MTRSTPSPRGSCAAPSTRQDEGVAPPRGLPPRAYVGVSTPTHFSQIFPPVSSAGFSRPATCTKLDTQLRRVLVDRPRPLCLYGRDDTGSPSSPLCQTGIAWGLAARPQVNQLALYILVRETESLPCGG